MQKSKKGHNSAMTSPTDKKQKYGSACFSCYVNILNLTLSLTVLDRMQSVTDAQVQTSMLPQLLRSWGHKKATRTSVIFMLGQSGVK